MKIKMFFCLAMCLSMINLSAGENSKTKQEKSEGYYSWNATQLSHKGQHARAIKYFEIKFEMEKNRTKKNNSSSFRDLYYYSLSLANVKRDKEAREAIYNCVTALEKLDLSNIVTAGFARKVYHQAGIAAIKNQECEKAINYLTKALTTKENYKKAVVKSYREKDDDVNGNSIVNSLILLGESYYLSKNYDKANSTWDKVLTKYSAADDTLLSKTHYKLGKVEYHNLANKSKALKHWKKAIKLDKSNKYALLSMGCNYFKRGKNRRASKYFAELYLTNNDFNNNHKDFQAVISAFFNEEEKSDFVDKYSRAIAIK